MRLFLASVLSGLLCAAGCAPADEAPAASAAAAPVDPLGRVFILGLDGADWSIVDRLAAQGQLPNLERLRGEGAWGVLRSEQPLLSPIVWTTIATGRKPLDHGIMGFLTVRDGQTEPVRSDERRVRAFWNVASEMGVSVGVVGWYASWPAEAVDGFLVSDRVGYHQVSGTAERVSTGLAYPESLVPEIDAVRRQIERRLDASAAARFFRAGAAGGARVQVDQQRLSTFVGILRTTELYRAMVPELERRYRPDLTAVYLEGTDSVGHLFAEYVPPALPHVDKAQAVHLGAAFDRFYAYTDTVIGEIVSRLDPADTTLIVVSDHGFKTGDARPRVPTRSAHGDQAPLWHRPEGVLLMWGRGVRAGVELPEASIYDVLPTAFRALGLPVSLALPGRPLDAAFTPELLAHPVRSVPDYEAAGRRDRAERVELPADEVLAKLQALGYIGGSVAAAAGAAPAGMDDGQAAVPLNRYNMGIVLLNDGRRDEALALFGALQEQAPEFALGYLGEGMIHIHEGRFAEAAGRLERAVELGSGMPAIHAALGEAYQGMGKLDPAQAAFRRALELDGSDGRTALLLARLLLARGRLSPARPLFETARRFAAGADRAAAYVGLATIEEEGGAFERAAELYGEALRELPGYPPALERYANLELYLGHADRAVTLLESLVAAAGDDPGTLVLYGRALALAGRTEDARSVLERALSRDPGRSDARQLLDGLGGAPS